MIKIYFSEDSEVSEIESIEKGCRLDVLVEIDGKYFKPLINTLGRLSQEVNDAFEENKVYDMEPCQMLVQETSKGQIIKTILELDKRKFFNSFCPIDIKKMFENNFIQLTDIKNWIQVY